METFSYKYRSFKELSQPIGTNVDVIIGNMYLSDLYLFNIVDTILKLTILITYVPKYTSTQLKKNKKQDA